MTELCAKNPMRPVDWRWRRAQAISEGRGVNASKLYDGVKGFYWIRRAAQYLRALQRATSEAAELRLSEKFADVYWAHYLWRHPPPMKYAIEAYLLARSESWQIAQHTGFTESAIDAYEAVFFNVRPKIEQKGYIVHKVLGPAVQQGLADREYDLLWKMYGYFLGPHVLAAIETRFSSPLWCDSPDGVGDAIQDDAISTLKLRAAIAAKTVPVNGGTQMALLEQFTKFVEVERNTDSAGKAQSAIMGHIGAMMTALPFDIGGEDANSYFDRSAVELTYEESMQVSSGKAMPHLQDLRRLTFPDPPSVIQQ